MTSNDDLSRRRFLGDAGKLALGAAIAPTIVPRHVLGRGFQAPSDTVNFAVIGMGGMGGSNAFELSKTETLVAVCDVDLAYADHQTVERGMRDGKETPEGARFRAQYAKAKRYVDYREMLAKEKGIDGVIIATPDHVHAVSAVAAMQAGKHVYVQKPLCYSVHEARVLGELARKNPKLQTQMGNQGHSSEGARRINEWVQGGIIGPVHEVHVWTNRPVVYWPQGVPRPSGAPVPAASPSPFGNPWSFRRVNEVLASAMGSYPVPPGLRWDLYLGPVAEDIAYHPIYHPFNWRGWLDFGASALGDMGAHLIDHPFWALGLTYPTSVEATSTQWGVMPLPPDPSAANGGSGRPRYRPVSYPVATTVHYQFAARGAQPPVKMNWYDGGLYPPRPDLLPDDVVLKSEGGVIMYGEKGILMHDTYGANPRIWPESLMAEAQNVPKSIPRIETSHELNWANAIRGTAKSSSPLEYASQLTETMLLGIAALRAGQGRKVLYDGANMSFTNAPDANQYLTREYRQGWAI
jgi:predicted dehydrogenase